MSLSKLDKSLARLCSSNILITSKLPRYSLLLLDNALRIALFLLLELDVKIGHRQTEDKGGGGAMPMELLSIQPNELQFPFELKKQISCSLRLVNLTEHYVAFKVKTTSPKKYCVRPNTGVVLPQSSTDITVTMQAQRESPLDMQCKDKFLIQSVIAPHGFSAKDVSQELFNKEPGKDICEMKLRALYVPPPQPPSPVLESTEEGLSPKSSYLLDTADQNMFFMDTSSKEVNELRAKLTEARAALTSLNEERNAALRKTQLLQQELAQVVPSKSKAEITQCQQRFSIMFVIIVAILSFVLGILVY